MNAIDTNVLVYAFDADEPSRREVAVQFINEIQLQAEKTVLLWQVAAEFLNCLRSWHLQKKMTRQDVELHFRDITFASPLTLPTPSILERSFLLHSRYSLSHWDSLLVAACSETGVQTLYSEDMQ